MNTDETPETVWTSTEENLLVLARELEWAEAYAEHNPECSMGQLYLDFLRWEMIMSQAEI